MSLAARVALKSPIDVKVSPAIKRRAKILTYDLETKPLKVFSWGLRKQFLTPDQIIEDGGIICWSAKWYSEAGVQFSSVHGDGYDTMIGKLWSLLDEADVVVGFNHRGFDNPLSREAFIVGGYAQPMPWQDIDLLTEARQMRMPSHKLDNVSRRLDIGAKVRHEGFGLWRKCMDGDDAAWARMEKYAKQDTRLTERLFDRMRPWLKTAVNLGLFGDDECRLCPSCGSANVELQVDRRIRTPQTAYPAFRCLDCTMPFRSKHRQAAASFVRAAR